MKTPKVFCIGMHKTGTTSVGNALTILGYKVKSTHAVTSEPEACGLIDAMLRDFDAVEDHPWPLLYKYLDKKCPGSKFILTIRNTNSWFASVGDFFGSNSTPMRKWIYGQKCGAPAKNKDVYVKRFEQHNAEVQEYFCDRPHDLLVLDLSKGNVWEKMCNFLNVAVPSVPFPHANKSGTYNAHRKLADTHIWLE